MGEVRRWSRREWVRMSAGALLAAGWPGALRAKEGAGGAFSFFAINDLHYTDAGCGPFFERLVKQLKGTEGDPEFCLLLGDLSENGKAEQLDAIARIFKGLGKPVYAVVGNHDYRTMTDRKAYEEAFPKSINYTFEHRGWQFMGLDMSEGANSNVTAGKAMFDYLDETLPKIDKNRPLVAFTHFPLGPQTTYRVKNADAVLDRFKEHNLRAVLSGHFHAFTERKRGDVVLTTNRCCALRRENHSGPKEKGYFVCRVEGVEMTREFVEMKVG